MPSGPGVEPGDLATTLRVLGELHRLPAGHPDIETIKRATRTMQNRIRKARRTESRQAEQAPLRAADEAVLAATATGSPLRIDDETRGIPLTAATPAVHGGLGTDCPDDVSSTDSAGGTDTTAGLPIAGHLHFPRGCYICHATYTQVDAFYHWLCPECAATSHARRDQHADLRGKRALLTGGRAKIGMYIALRLLRDGADLTITTRFPRDAARRFAALADAPEWLDRLTIVGIDLRGPTQVVGLADEVASRGPLDILVNNAAQTVRRSPGAYAHLVEGESAPLMGDATRPELITYERVSQAHPAALAGTLRTDPASHGLAQGGPAHDPAQLAARTAADMTSMALTAGHASLEAHRAGTAIDAGGLLPDLQRTNSWTHTIDQVDPLELLEVQLCNATAPFILISRLRPAMRAAVQAGARRAYVVNVSAMEGQFARRYKGPGHPHTNMAKAGLNMLTRTSAGEMFENDRICMTAVDTGWITDERPHTEKLRIAEEGWHAPLDLVDGAARVYDPIVRGERGEDVYGVFLKDYEPYPW